MTHEEYVSKTSTVTNFLMHIFDDDVQCVAGIVSAQADQNTERLMFMLEFVEEQCKTWIEELKAMEEQL